MTNFKTRKSDGQVFPTDRKTSRESGNPNYVGVDKSQIEKKDIPVSEKYPIYALEDPEGHGMTEKETLALWQHGVDTGIVWRLQGWYGRNAQAMLDAGTIKYPRKHREQSSTDYWGKKIPTHEQAIKLKLYKKDTDKDGVPDKDDCEPFNKKKQGILHDIKKRFQKGTKPQTAKQQEGELKALEKERERVEGLATHQQKVDAEKRKIEEAKDVIRESRKKEFDKSFIGRIKKVATSEKTKKTMKKLLADEPKRKSSKKSSKKKRKSTPKKAGSKEGLGGLFE